MSRDADLLKDLDVAVSCMVRWCGAYPGGSTPDACPNCELRIALHERLEAPQWTREPPTREGGYWVKTNCCMFVWHYDEAPAKSPGVECGDGATVFEWLGPLEPPK